MKKKRITVALYLNKMNRSDKVKEGTATHDAVNRASNKAVFSTDSGKNGLTFTASCVAVPSFTLSLRFILLR